MEQNCKELRLCRGGTEATSTWNYTQPETFGCRCFPYSLVAFPLVSLGFGGTVGFPGGTSGKEPACQGRRCKRHGFDP